MFLDKSKIESLERVYKLNLINSITGIKPANLIGTVGQNGITNLAIFSSVVHLGSNPPLLGFILRPFDEVPRHTFENIVSSGFYTINHVLTSSTKSAHYTSAKFSKEESEFEFCKFTEEYIEDFKAPFVQESNIKIGLSFVEQIPIAVNNTSLIIGKVELIKVEDELVNEKGYIDLEKADSAGISGLNSYYSFKKIDSYPYARRNELPEF